MSDYTVVSGSLDEGNKVLMFRNNNWNWFTFTYFTDDKSLRNTNPNAHLTYQGLNI